MAEPVIGKYLLNIPKGEFQAAQTFFRENPDATKLNRKDVIRQDGSKFTYSYVRAKREQGGKAEEVIIAKAYGEALGEGAYSKVMLCEDSAGNNLAVKIEGVGKKADDEAEKKIGYAIGYIKGAAKRKLDFKKQFKGSETEWIQYTLMELKQGKELFQHIYSSKILIEHPGYLYSPQEVEGTRIPLTTAQKYIAAIKVAQALSELHNRRIVHGDPKPANFMGNIDGNKIVIVPVDFGTSNELAPDQTKIELDRKPQGTPDRYMPPEVLQVDRGGKAVFSFQSDIYSFGKICEYDLQLPLHLTKSLTHPDPNARMALPDAIRVLARQLEALPEEQLDSEARKFLNELNAGVKQIDEKKGPQAKSSFIGQLMSGFRDPRELVGVSRSTVYTTDDYANVVRLLYSTMKPSEFFDALTQAYTELSSDEEREIYLHNAEILIKKLIHHDLRYQSLDETNHGLQGFYTNMAAQNPSAKITATLESIKQRLEPSLLEASYAKERHLRHDFVELEEGELDIHDYVYSTLAGKNPDGETLSANAEALASDFFERQKHLLTKTNITDMYNKAWDKDKTLSVQDFPKLFNQISNMVASDILQAKSRTHQVNVAFFYYNVLKQSIEKGDFQTAMAINSAFSQTPINRLQIEKDFSEADRKNLQDIQSFLDSSKNYKNLRAEFYKRRREGKPALFSMVVFLGAVFQINEGNPVKNKTTKKENDVLMSMLGKEFNDYFIEPQAYFFRQPPTEKLQTNLSKNLTFVLNNEDELYALSKIIMPSTDNRKKSFNASSIYLLVKNQIETMMAANEEYRQKRASEQVQAAIDALKGRGEKIDKKILDKINAQLEVAADNSTKKYVRSRAMGATPAVAPGVLASVPAVTVEAVSPQLPVAHSDALPPSSPSRREELPPPGPSRRDDLPPPGPSRRDDLPLAGPSRREEPPPPPPRLSVMGQAVTEPKPPRAPPRGPFYTPDSGQDKHLPGVLKKGPTAAEWKIAKEYFERNPAAVKLSRRSTELGVSHSFIQVRDEKGEKKIYVLRLANETGKAKTLATSGKKKQKLLLAEDENRNRFAVRVEEYNREKINESEINILKELNFYHGHARRVQKQAQSLLGEADSKEKGYIVMPYVAGHDLYSGFLRPSAFSLLSERDKLQIALQMVKKVKWLHARGILHRDLKAQNFMAHRNAKGGWDVLPIDWGTAIKLDEDKDNVLGSPVGTKGFQAPELTGSQWNYSMLTDAYSLGVILKVQLGIFLPEGEALLESSPAKRMSSLKDIEEALSNKLSTTLPTHYFDIKNKVSQYPRLDEKEKARVLNHLASIPLLSQESREHYPLTLDILQQMHVDIQTLLLQQEQQPWIRDFYPTLEENISVLAIERAIIEAKSVAAIPEILSRHGLSDYFIKVSNELDAVEQKARDIKGEQLIPIASSNLMTEFINRLQFTDAIAEQASEHLKLLLKEKYIKNMDWGLSEAVVIAEEPAKGRWQQYVQTLTSTWQKGNPFAKPLAPLLAIPSLFSEKKEPSQPAKLSDKSKKKREWLATEKELLGELNRVTRTEEYTKAHPLEVQRIKEAENVLEPLPATLITPSNKSKARPLPTTPSVMSSNGIPLRRTEFLTAHSEQSSVFKKELTAFFNQGTPPERLQRKKHFGLNVIMPEPTIGPDAVKLVFSAEQPSKTNTVYAQMSKEKGVTFSLERKVRANNVEFERVIMQVCSLAVATAKPGTDYTINEKEETKKQQIRDALHSAIVELGKKESQFGALSQN